MEYYVGFLRGYFNEILSLGLGAVHSDYPDKFHLMKGNVDGYIFATKYRFASRIAIIVIVLGIVKLILSLY